MRLRLGLFAVISFVVFLISAGISSFVVDPENLGIRLALYVLARLALIGTVLFTVFAIVFPLFGRTGVKPAEVAAAIAAGRQAHARVTSARATGGQLESESLAHDTGEFRGERLGHRGVGRFHHHAHERLGSRRP